MTVFIPLVASFKPSAQAFGLPPQPLALPPGAVAIVFAYASREDALAAEPGADLLALDVAEEDEP